MSGSAYNPSQDESPGIVRGKHRITRGLYYEQGVMQRMVKIVGRSGETSGCGRFETCKVEIEPGVLADRQVLVNSIITSRSMS